MRILILGLNHQIQRRVITSWGSDGKPQAFEKDQKDRFTELLREILHKYQIEFVGEETRPGEESLTEWVCKEQNCRYANVEMTPEERTRRKILPGYNENPDFTDEEKARGNDERENYMMDEILKQAQGAQNSLVICGRMHSDLFAERFRSLGHAIEIDDLQNKNWYVEDWQHHMMHNL
jgi:hypothetical protein